MSNSLLYKFFFVTFLYQSDSINEKGHMGGLWFTSVNLYTCILMVVSVDLIIFTRYHTFINFLIFLIFFFFLYILCNNV